MNDIRRTILWVIFGFSLVLLWDKWQVHNGKKATFFPAPAVATAPAPETGKAPGDASVPSAATAATAGAGEVPGGAAAPEAAPRQNVTISTDVLRLTFDSQGGTLRHAELLKYADSAHKDKPVVLFDESVHRVYLGQSGLIGGGFPTHKTTMTALNPAPPDPMQAKMMWIMPLVFSVMFFFFPAGLVLYWLTNNILSIAQQWIINTRMGVPPQFNLPNFGKTKPAK